MRTLWDLHPELPYHAWAPWPRVDSRGYQDWEGSICIVDQWLTQHVGNRWVDWTWGWGTFNMDYSYHRCCVNFRRESHTTLFLLRFS